MVEPTVRQALSDPRGTGIRPADRCKYGTSWPPHHGLTDDTGYPDMTKLCDILFQEGWEINEGNVLSPHNSTLWRVTTEDINPVYPGHSHVARS